MPIPKRQSGEAEKDFIGRCASKLIGEEGYENDQALAICYQQLSIQLTGDKDWRKDFMGMKDPGSLVSKLLKKK